MINHRSNPFDLMQDAEHLLPGSAIEAFAEFIGGDLYATQHVGRVVQGLLLSQGRVGDQAGWIGDDFVHGYKSELASESRHLIATNDWVAAVRRLVEPVLGTRLARRRHAHGHQNRAVNTGLQRVTPRVE